jgi:hypothetical protein
VSKHDLQWSRLSKRMTSAIGLAAATGAFRKAGFTVFEADETRTPTRFAVARGKGTIYDVRVRTCRPPGGNYTFLTKSELELRESVVVVLVLLHEGESPDLYLIPSLAWQEPSSLLVDRDYEGLASAPEWGISLSGKSLPLLAEFNFAREAGRL